MNARDKLFILYREKAKKWDDPQTQADLELAAAVKAWFNQKNWHSSFAADMGMACKRFNSIDKLINWFREQKRGAE